MTTLANYESQVADLLHDPQQQIWSLAQLDNYINEARRQLVMDTGCLRSLQLVYFTPGVESYTFGQVTGGVVLTGGSGYVNPTVSFAGGGGTGVAATLGVASGAVNSITFTNLGSGYSSAPTPILSAGLGSVLSLSVANPGLGFVSVPALAFSGGGGGSGAAGTVNLKVVAANFWLNSTGYSLGDVLTASGGIFVRPMTILVTGTLTPGDGRVLTWGILDPGEYSTLPGAQIPGTGGDSGATGPVTFTGGTGIGGIQWILHWGCVDPQVTAGGANYTVAPNVNTSGGAPNILPVINATLGPASSGATLGIGAINVNTYDILDVHLIYSGYRYTLDWKPFSQFSAQLRSWLSSNYQSRPQVWSGYGDSQLFLGPAPDQPYLAELDTVILPTPIGDYVTVDPIPIKLQDPIKFYAASLAKDYQQAFGEAEAFRAAYLRRLLELIATGYQRRIGSQYA